MRLIRQYKMKNQSNVPYFTHSPKRNGRFLVKYDEFIYKIILIMHRCNARTTREIIRILPIQMKWWFIRLAITCLNFIHVRYSTTTPSQIHIKSNDFFFGLAVGPPICKYITFSLCKNRLCWYWSGIGKRKITKKHAMTRQMNREQKLIGHIFMFEHTSNQSKL